MSISVLTGVVTGMPYSVVTSRGWSDARRWIRSPGRFRWDWLARESSISERSSAANRHSAAALEWLRTASSPQARTAAIHLPLSSTTGRSTEYTPRRILCSRPMEIRCLIASGVKPNAKSCLREITPCCCRTNPHTWRVVGAIAPTSRQGLEVRPLSRAGRETLAGHSPRLSAEGLPPGPPRRALDHAEAAAYAERLARHVAGVVAGQEGDCRRDLLGPAEAAHLGGAFHRLDHLLADLAELLGAHQQGGLDRAGGDRVGGDAVAGGLAGDRLGEADHAGLGGAICG